MGLAEVLFGAQSPIAQWAGQNQNFLGAVGAGLGQGQNIQSGLSAGLAAVPGAKALDREHAEKLKAEAKIEAQTNATQAWLEKKYPDLAQMVQAGMPVSEAWNAAMERMTPQQTDYPAEYDLFKLTQTDPEFAKYLQSQKPAGSLPTSYQEWMLAQENPEYGATLASSSTKPPTEGERRNQQLASVIGPELESVETNWQALTDAGNQMKGAEINGDRPGLALTSPEYQQAINSLSTIVASYLYSVSGATATDEEIKRQVNLLTPKLGESKASADAKLDRIRTYAQAVEQAAGRAGAGAAPDDPLGIR